MESSTRRDVAARLGRAAGQIEGLRRMVEQDDDCVRLLVQIAAAQGALGRVGQIVLGSHIETCVTDTFERGGDAERRRRIEELMEVFARYSRIGAR